MTGADEREPDGFGLSQDGAGERASRRNRALRRGAVATGLVRLATALTSFGTYAIAARVLSKDEFGLVAVLISLWLILTMFDMGLGGALATRVAMSHAREDFAEIRVHVNHALVTLGPSAGSSPSWAASARSSCRGRTGSAVTSPSDTLVRSLIITFVVAGAAMPAAVGHVCMSGMQRFATAQTSLAAGGLAGLAASVVVAFAHPPADVFVLAVLGAPLLVSVGFSAWVVLSVLPSADRTGRFEASRFKAMVRASGYYGLYNIGNMVSMGTSTLIVGSILGLAEAAVFSVAVRLFNPIITVIAAAGSQLWPPLTEAIARGDVAWARSSYRRGLLYVTAISVAASVAIVAIGPWFSSVWVGPDLVPSVTLFLWTAALTVVLAVTLQVGVVLMALERMRGAAVLSVCTAVAGVVVSILLTRTFGASGAAIGATAACLGILLPGSAVLARSSLATETSRPAGSRTAHTASGGAWTRRGALTARPWPVGSERMPKPRSAAAAFRASCWSAGRGRRSRRTGPPRRAASLARNAEGPRPRLWGDSCRGEGMPRPIRGMWSSTSGTRPWMMWTPGHSEKLSRTRSMSSA